MGRSLNTPATGRLDLVQASLLFVTILFALALLIVRLTV